MKVTFAAIFALFFATAAVAQDPKPSGVIDLTLIDVPDMYNEHLRVPTMQQSLDVTSAFYESSAVAIDQLFGKHDTYSRLTIGLFDLLTIADTPIPPGDAWLHEEFHRSVLSHRGISSYNDVYNFDYSGNSIAVSHVKDEDLIRLKAEHPEDQVRLQEAGIEGELLLTQRLQKNHFFRNSNAWHLPLYWVVKLSTWGYVQSGGTHDSDVETDESNITDGTNVPKRDFTGHDFNGWVYDLFRPDEPYTARGIHPSGVGINRYRKSTDMTQAEKDFLHRQGRLQLINFLDPNLFGVYGMNVHGVKFNANAAHFLTSFGYTIDGNVFLRKSGHNAFITVHDYVNGERSFPGIDAELIDEPFHGLAISPRVALWSQPENQRFDDGSGSFGGLLGVRVAKPMTNRVSAFVDVTAKTSGWVAGNVHLEPATEVKLGMTMRIGG
jgi:hypothetical protein